MHLMAALKRKHAVLFGWQGPLAAGAAETLSSVCIKRPLEDSPAVAAGHEGTGGKADMLLSWLAGICLRVKTTAHETHICIGAANVGKSPVLGLGCLPGCLSDLSGFCQRASCWGRVEAIVIGTGVRCCHER